MAAIPVPADGKAMFVLWLDLTQMFVDQGGILVGDTVSQAQTKLQLERDAH